MRYTNRWIWLSLFVALLSGCIEPAEREVVVYTALDREFSEAVFEQFTRETGIAVRAKYDVESTKTVGLAEAILRERARPRCDLFWNNEILHTLRLQDAGILAAYAAPRAAHYPAMYRAPDGAWHGFAARARVLIVNRDLVAREQFPQSIRDLADPRWRGQVGLAKPLFGTTATHAACLFAVWGDDPAREFFEQLKSNCQILAGNKQVAVSVAAGRLAFGLTDTDDAMVEISRGGPVEIVYPDQQPDAMGTLFIPNTLGLIQGGPHGDDARRLVDFL
ncbi:MAG: extracellular solute-binding protein, partial [Planctomycetales bacterium]|nr:extracellular solute-binding protein [Planctomycetales bacterium]